MQGMRICYNEHSKELCLGNEKAERGLAPAVRLEYGGQCYEDQ